MSEFVQLLIAGLMVGSIYGLIGIGFTTIYNVTGIVNFAQGDFAMIGALSAIMLHESGLSLGLAIALAIVLVGVIAAVIERVAVRPIGTHVTRGIVATIGIGVVLQGAAALIWGTDAQPMPGFSGERPFNLGGTTVLPQALWIFGTSAALMLLLFLFFRHTYPGKIMRACAINPFAAQLMGIRLAALRTFSFFLSGAVGAVGGIIIAPIALTQYDSGISLGIKGFVACIIGGFGNPVGAAVGGLLLGILEAMSSGFVSSGFKDAISFALLLVFLVVRPGGLLGDLEKVGRRHGA
jgi:branched-chain amino acid transport system permease protein